MSILFAFKVYIYIESKFTPKCPFSFRLFNYYCSYKCADVLRSVSALAFIYDTQKAVLLSFCAFLFIRYILVIFSDVGIG